MSDQDIKVLILAGLPSEYGHTRQIIRGKNNIALEEVRSLLLSAEYEIELENKALPLSSLAAMVAQNGVVNSSQAMQYGIPNTGTSSHAIFPSQYAGNWSLASTLHTAASSMGLMPTDYGIPKNYMISSAAINVPNVTSSCQDMTPFTTNFGASQTMLTSGYMLNYNIGNGSCFSAPIPSYGYAPQTRGFMPQHDNGVHTPVSQQGFSQNNVSQQQDSFSQASNNSHSDGGYAKDNLGYPNFPNKGANYSDRNHGNMNDNNRPRNNDISSFNNPIVCQICEKPGHSASICYYRFGVEASTSIVKCQICKRLGHSAKTCRYRQQSNNSENSPISMVARNSINNF
ncbi:uncharacterized protein LOC133738212 [Rosa rugosa]|uniref:uncharacterized protein LOC133738212 n=1 Tax=Rosa rugosa TaxID=74645 RepID=UPI002B4180CF|nr:uncharacterized protein LOC133738212 [Rosa rugosa]